MPQLSIDNYLADEEFHETYQYLKDDTLTGDNKRDRVVLLLLDQYFIENNALYRRTTPKNKREKRWRVRDEIYRNRGHVYFGVCEDDRHTDYKQFAQYHWRPWIPKDPYPTYYEEEYRDPNVQ